LARELDSNGTNEALRKWGTHPTQDIQSAITDYFQYKDVPSQMRQMDGVEDSFRIAQVYAGMWLTAGTNLRLNAMSDEVELWNTVVAGKECGQLLLRNRGWAYGKLPTFEEVEVYAQAYRYSPVEDYLLRNQATEGNHLETLYDVGRIALGITDELGLEMVAKTLIGAVARALSPGCEQQTCLVLQGPQGAGKTTFFKALFGNEFFGHLDTNRDQREWAMAMATKWCVELGELEAFTSKKSAGMLKNFLSSATDTYRRPYDRKPRTVPRHSICVGSVNVGCPLVDETGNRRYWMVPVGDRLNIEWVRSNRDRIWAAARVLYDKGEAWWFDYDTEKVVMDRAEQYRQTHPWEDVLSELLPALNSDVEAENPKVREMVFGLEKGNALTSSVLLAMLGVSVDRQTKAHSNQLGSIMRSLGWGLKVVKRNGKQQKEWLPDGN
jgi:predicted P-loop ATPase